MWNMTADQANLWFSVSNTALVIAAVVVALATYGVLVTGSAKEHFADARIAQNERDTAFANARAAEANQKAETERLERLKIEAKLTPRRLSARQKVATVNSLKMLAFWDTPSGRKVQSAAVFPTTSAHEPAALADDIAEALGAAGWAINRNTVHYGKPLAVSGVGILTASNPRGIRAAEAVVESLAEHGIAAFVIKEKRSGCEEMGYSAEKIESEPSCSSISIFVGERL